MPEGDDIIYECWIADDRKSFSKLETAEDVVTWLWEILPECPLHKNINIVLHERKEYR